MERIYFNRNDQKSVRYNPTKWTEQNKTQTKDGYGSKLNTGYEVFYNNKYYKVYMWQYSNVGTAYIIVSGRKIVVDF